MKKIILLLVISPFLLFSQNNSSTPNSLSFFGSVSYEYNFLGGINNFLKQIGYYPLLNEAQSMSALVLGVQVDNKGPLFGRGYIYSSFKQSLIEKSSMSYYGIGVDILYNLNKKEKWSAAPMLGLLIARADMVLVSDNTHSSITGTNVEELFRRMKYGIKLGISFDRKFNFKGRMVSIGFAPFYELDLGIKSWKNSYGIKIPDAPKFGCSSFGLRINVVSNISR